MDLTRYSDLTETIGELQKRGFTRTFFFKNNQLTCFQTDKNYAANQLNIVEYHRFSGDEFNPEKSIIIAVQCVDQEKGYIISTDQNMQTIRLMEFMDKAKIQPRKSTILHLDINDKALRT